MMIERFILVLVLALAGYMAYRLFSRYHLGRATGNAATDPILHGLRPGILAIVYFTIFMCIFCRIQQQPALARLQTELGEGIQIIQIDATQDAEAADRWGVFSAPTTFLLDIHRQVREVNYGVADAPKLKRQLETLGFASDII